MASSENTVPETPSKEVPELQATREASKDTNPKEDVPVDRPPSTASSGSNSESLSAYAERTVAAIAQRDSTVADPTLVPTSLVENSTTNDTVHKESESCTIEVTPRRPPSTEVQMKTDGKILDTLGEEEEEQDDVFVFQDLYSKICIPLTRAKSRNCRTGQELVVLCYVGLALAFSRSLPLPKRKKRLTRLQTPLRILSWTHQIPPRPHRRIRDSCQLVGERRFGNVLQRIVQSSYPSAIQSSPLAKAKSTLSYRPFLTSRFFHLST